MGRAKSLKYKAKLIAREEIKRAQQSRVLLYRICRYLKNSIRLSNSSNNPNKIRREKN
jgi:hypothetical protein